ncbi:helix-turn-helix domain-containing protein [Sphingomonas sp. CJ99]
MAKNVNHKGRRQEPAHVRLYNSITQCEAWRDLSGNAVKVLIALARMDKGGHNGELFMSARKAALETGLSTNTAHRCLAELEQHGFIAPTEKGYFRGSASKATQWRLTWVGAPGYPPTRDFEKWEPIGKDFPSQKLSGAVANIARKHGNENAPVANIGTGDTETSDVSKAVSCSNIATQVVSQGQGPNEGNSSQRKQADYANGAFADFANGVDLDALRESLRHRLSASPAGTQTSLARQAGIPGGTLSKFIGGRGLPDRYRRSLASILSAAA